LQHAVHERIRLEELLEQHTSLAEPEGHVVVVRYLLPGPLSLALTNRQQEILADNSALANRFGLVQTPGKPSVLFEQIPLCFASLDSEKMESALRELGRKIHCAVSESLDGSYYFKPATPNR
jgi:DNA mismatch repair ATPase MutL